MLDKVPVIDFKACIPQVKEDDVSREELKKAGAAIAQAFRTTGFCYIQHHGVPQTFLDSFLVNSKSKEFFMHPDSVKDKLKRQPDRDDYIGYVGREKEAANPDRPGDLRETFNYSPIGDWKDWPEDASDFKSMSDEFFNQSAALSARFMKALALGLGFPDDSDLNKCHSLVGKPGNVSQSRTSYYPPVIDSHDVKADQVYVGEHFDFGSLTIFFQNDLGHGLEACTREGEFVPVEHKADTALVCVGELLQKWTADDFIATKHKAVIPFGPESAQGRQSMVFYLVPDDAATIKCLDGSDKYAPDNVKTHLSQMMHRSMN